MKDVSPLDGFDVPRGYVIVDEDWFNRALSNLEEKSIEFRNRALREQPPENLKSLPEFIPDHAAFLDLICDEPGLLWIDRDGEGGRATIAGPSLIVSQTLRGHRRIRSLLDQLREVVRISGPPIHPHPAPFSKLQR